MVCPCRVGKEYDFKKVGDSILIAGEREVYPECYEDYTLNKIDMFEMEVLDD